VEDASLAVGAASATASLVVLNGGVLGLHRRPEAFGAAFRRLRRLGYISEYVSIHANVSQVRCLRSFSVGWHRLTSLAACGVPGDGRRARVPAAGHCRPGPQPHHRPPHPGTRSLWVSLCLSLSLTRRQDVEEGCRSFDDFIREGLVEYLDVNEENDARIALRDHEIGPDTTHVEIAPLTVLGVCAGCVRRCFAAVA
jgi:DNA-directed RNA polymerase III subunit RPC2